jgi:hypothetical protein
MKTMNELSSELYLHEYSGKENGLMVIGTSETLKALGLQLIAAGDVPRKTFIDGWPASVADPTTIGPYRNGSDYQLSFHIAGSTPLSEILPLSRRGPHALFTISVAILSIIGIITISKWLFSLFA